MSYCHGIDVSNNNGEFDWAEWPAIDFAAAKAIEGPHDGQGMFHDGQFARNWRLMKDVYDNKLVRIAYCFAHYTGGEAGMDEQARTITEVVKDNGLQPGDHYAVDVEPYAGLNTPDGLPGADVARLTRRFCEQVNKLNPDHRCLVYAGNNMADEGCTAGLWPWRLWVPDYNPALTVPEPWASRPWKQNNPNRKAFAIWQFEPGSNTDAGDPDKNVFDGDKAALLDFARMPAYRR